MSLSSELVSQFVKITNDDKKTSEERTVLGTTVEYNGSIYVKIDGSDLLTPVSTTTNVKSDERVTVLIKDHTATITGNMSSPSARTEEVEQIGSKISEFEIVIAYRVTTDDLNAINAFIDDLKAITAKFENMTAVDAEIESLRAQLADVEYLSAKDIEAITAKIETLRATFGDFEDLSTEDLEAANAEIDSLRAYVGDFTYISADVLDAIKATIKELEANTLTVKEADIKYANIDFSNISKAAIEYFYATSGLIKDVTVGDGIVTGELVGVTIKGDLIEAGTLKADRLVIKGSDGNYYKLNTDFTAMPGVEPVEEDTIHGSVILANSITAEKINVHDLVAFGATIGGFNITDKSIYSGVKSSIDNTTEGIYFDSEGQFVAGDSDNYLKFFKDTDGSYKLAISASKIILSASKKNIEDVIEEVQNGIDNLSIGTRNLLLNSSLTENLNEWDNKKTASGRDVLVIDDVPSSQQDLNITVTAVNLYPISNITETSPYGKGSVALTNTWPSVPYYTASADITRYEDDDVPNPRMTMVVTYTDSTSVTFDSEIDMSTTGDGVTRRKSVTATIDTSKTIRSITLYALNSDASFISTAARNAKAENIQFEYGSTATPYVPYISSTTWTGLTVSRTGKNLCPVDSIASGVTAHGNQYGAVRIYGLPHGTYTASADITRYEDDSAANARFTFFVQYTDNTKTTKSTAHDTEKAEADGLTRNKSLTITTNTSKTIQYIEIRTLEYGTSATTGSRNAKAENIQLEFGDTATPYTPYVTESGTLEEMEYRKSTVKGLTSISPSMIVFASTGTSTEYGISISVEYDGSDGQFTTKDRKQCLYINRTESENVTNISQRILNKLEANMTYTLSGYVLTENITSVDEDSFIGFAVDYQNGKHLLPINVSSGSWNHVMSTFMTDDTLDADTEVKVSIFAQGVIGDIYVCNLKLERGNKATEWTPAPEEVAISSAVEVDLNKVLNHISTLEVNTNSINAAVKSINDNVSDRLNNLDDAISNLSSEVKTKMTSDSVTLEINKVLKDHTANKVVTESKNFRFDDSGMTVAEGDMSTMISEDGMEVSKKEKAVLKANSDGVDAENLHATTFLIVGNNSRFENYTKNGEARTACFWIGG